MRITSTRLIWLFLALVWGSTWLCIKVGLQYLPPFTFVGVRFVVAVAPLAFYVYLRRLPMPRSRKDWALLAGTGILTFGVSYGLVFWGEQYISSGLTAVLFATYPFFGMIFAHLALPSEPMTLRRMAGAVLGIAGVAVIFADQLGLSGARAGLGSLAIVLAAISGALSGVLLKKHGNRLDPAVVTVTQMAIGGLPMVFLGLVLEGNPFRLDWSPKAVFCLLYLALVGTSLAFVLWYKLLQASRVTRVQMMPLANTVVAVGMGWLILGEKYGLRGVAGGAAVLAGLALALVRPGKTVEGVA